MENNIEISLNEGVAELIQLPTKKEEADKPQIKPAEEIA